MSLITLTTDFGLNDWFVGTMKGVILGINPRATIVDITHDIRRGDIRAGAFALMASCRFFPRHTVHVAVVDPGVGSARGAIAVRTAEYFFVGPDNGVLSWALRQEKITSIRRLENETLLRHPISRTFHGRDIFAPVAAHLSKGLNIAKLGPEQKEFVCLPWPEPQFNKSGLKGKVLYLDRFGNAITNISRDFLIAAELDEISVRVGRRMLRGLKQFYQQAREGEPLALLSSSGFLELAVNGGSAEEALKLNVGDRVTVRIPRRKPKR